MMVLEAGASGPLGAERRTHASGREGSMGSEDPLEGPDDLIPLARAAELSGLCAKTLNEQIRKGRLRSVLFSRDRATTRRWLHEYLRDRQGGRSKELPAGYVAPVEEQEGEVR
jgi:hypothetical protein